MKFDRSVPIPIAERIRAIVEQPGFAHGFGIIEAAHPCAHQNRRGYLVWSYVYHSEIFFLPEAGGAPESLYVSVGDAFARDKFNDLVAEIGD